MRSHYKNLIINSAVFAVNAFATKIIAFLLVPIYTSRLSAAEFGITDMSLTVISLVFPLATLSVVEAAVRMMISHEKESEEYAAISFSIVLLSIVLVAIMSPVLDMWIFGGLGKYKVLFVLAYASSALLNYCGDVARGFGQLKLIPLFATISSIVTLLCAVTFIRGEGRAVEAYFLSVSIGPTIAVFGYFFIGGFIGRLKRGYKGLVLEIGSAGEKLSEMLRYSLPLVPNSLFWWVGTSISRFFIAGMLGIAASGLYAASTKIPNLLNTFYSIFLQAWQLSAFQENDELERCQLFENVFRLLQAVITVACSLLALLAPILAAVLIKGESYESWTLIGMMLLSTVGNIFSSFYGTVFTSTLNTSCIMLTTVQGSVCSVLITPILMHFFGLAGAAAASVITQFVVLVARMRKAKLLVPFDPHLAILLPVLALLAVQALAMQACGQKASALSFACFLGVLGVQAFSILWQRRRS